MSCLNIKPITEPVQHAEGPFYDLNNDNLYFVDTFKATLYRHNLKIGKTDAYNVEGRNSVAVIIPIAGTGHEFIIGADRVLYQLNWPENNKNVTLVELVKIENKKHKNQFNDGKADNRGRLWIGTLTRNEDLGVAPKGGSLYMFTGRKNWLEHKEQIIETSISNGLAWSNDGRQFYFVDTEPGLVFSYDYKEENGIIDNKQIVFDIKDHPELKGLPDGMTIDTDNNLWIALFGGKAIINVDPRRKQLLRKVEMPVTYITSACFGGSDLDILYVTTSKLHLSEVQLKKEPFAGSVFAISNLNVKGLPSQKLKAGLD